MEKYVTLLPYEVIGMITKGKKVYVLDKSEAEVYCVNSMTVALLASIMEEGCTGGRCEFWYVEDVSEDGEL